MRIVKDFPSVQKVINDILDWKDLLSTKDWDFRKLRIKNASPAVDDNDYVILSQLKSPLNPQNQLDQFYTIVFSQGGLVGDGEVSPGFVIGNGREGIPVQVWMCCEGAPSSADLTANVSITVVNPLGNVVSQTSLLVDPIKILIGDTLRVFSSTFINPLPKFGNGTKINSFSVTGGDATDVSVGVVVKRILS